MQTLVIKTQLGPPVYCLVPIHSSSKEEKRGSPKKAPAVVLSAYTPGAVKRVAFLVLTFV